MSNVRKTTREATRARGRTSSAVGVDKTVAMQVLNACIAAEMKCFQDLMRYLGENSPRTKRLLEDVLALEESHAEELIQVLQGHRAESEREGGVPQALVAP